MLVQRLDHVCGLAPGGTTTSPLNVQVCSRSKPSLRFAVCTLVVQVAVVIMVDIGDGLCRQI